eukprot:1816795-Lingulodinium_polyedra.AAC.1
MEGQRTWLNGRSAAKEAVPFADATGKEDEARLTRGGFADGKVQKSEVRRSRLCARGCCRRVEGAA